MTRFALSILLLQLLSACVGLTVPDDEGPRCEPTGRAHIDTGVWIGAGGCDSVPLVASDEGPYASVNVAYVAPEVGTGSIVLWNRTTSDSEREAFFTGAPEFRLVTEAHPLGGLVVTQGTNTIEVYEWPCTSGQCESDVPVDAFELNVICTRAGEPLSCTLL